MTIQNLAIRDAGPAPLCRIGGREDDEFSGRQAELKTWTGEVRSGGPNAEPAAFGVQLRQERLEFVRQFFDTAMLMAKSRDAM
jgi:hypothetical protein